MRTRIPVLVVVAALLLPLQLVHAHAGPPPDAAATTLAPAAPASAEVLAPAPAASADQVATELERDLQAIEAARAAHDPVQLRLAIAALLALVLRVVLERLKRLPALGGPRWRRSLPLVATALGVVLAIADRLATGAPWSTALIIAAAGPGAILVNELWDVFAKWPSRAVLLGLILPLGCLALAGCNRYVVRDRNVYENETRFLAAAATQTADATVVLLKGCTCIDGRFANADCEKAARAVTLVRARVAYHRDLALYNAGVLAERPPREPPAIPPPESLCPPPPPPAAIPPPKLVPVPISRDVRQTGGVA